MLCCTCAGILPTNLHGGGGMVQPPMAGKQIHNKRISGYHPILRNFPSKHLRVDMEIILCDSNLCDRHDLPLLQQRSWTAWSFFLLAINRVFSDRNVHFTGNDLEVFVCMDMAQIVD